jgi:preprotein translocase subunit SecA
MEDSLMRIFGGERVKNLMGTFGIPEDQPLEMKLISRQLESAQTRIEGFHFDSRKQVLAYDDVLNLQRVSIYRRRHKLLEGDKEEIEAFKAEVFEDDKEAWEALYAAKQVEFGAEQFDALFAQLSLQMIDTLWVDHLDLMGHIRTSVNLRAYGQRDPLVEYRKEGTLAFNDMLESIKLRIKEVLPNIQPAAIAKEEVEHQKQAEAALKASETGSVPTTTGPRTVADVPGRNDVVVITNGSEEQEMKYKKAEPLLAEGWRIKE